MNIRERELESKVVDPIDDTERKSKDIVTLMEKEWPVMTAEFRKLQRVKTLLMTGRDSAVKDEPLEDAYLDVSNYGIMATIVSRGKWGK